MRPPAAAAATLRGLLGRVTVLLLAAALGSIAFHPPEGTAGAPLRTAVEDQGLTGLPDEQAAYDRIRAAGAWAIRIGVNWAQVAPSKPQGDASDPANPGYHWEVVDHQVALAGSAGLQPILSLYNPGEWAARQGDSGLPGARIVGPFRPDARQFGLFARAAAQRYSGTFRALPRVRYWQVWNEPNLSFFLLPQVGGGNALSPGIYRGLLNSAADAIHGVRRDNAVIAGGLTPFGARSKFFLSVAPLRFMRSLLCMSKGPAAVPTCGARARFDIWAHHPYTTGGPTHHAARADDVSLGDLPEMRRLLLSAVRAGHVLTSQKMRFWVTEFSWDTKPPDPTASVPPLDLQARWVSEAIYRMWRAGVSLVTWFQLRDEPYPASPYQSGLYFRGPNGVTTDKAKPALTAFRFPFVALRQTTGGVLVWGRAPVTKAEQVVVERRSGRAWEGVATLRSDRFGIFSTRLPDVRATASRAQSSRTPAALRRPAAASYAATVLADSPSSYWRLDDAGSTVRDVRGGLNGTYAGAPRLGAAGALRNDRDTAVCFDGSAGKATLGTVGSPRTVELWLKTASRADVAAFSNRNATSQYVEVGVSGGSARAFDTVGITGTGAVADGQWHHVVYTYASGDHRLYVDGRLAGQASGPRVEGAALASLGYDASLGSYFPGCVDEVAVYDHPLSATRALAHYLASGRTPSSGSGGARTGGYRATVLADSPASYWRLGDRGSQALDVLGRDTGTYAGSVRRGAPGALASDRDAAACLTAADARVSLPAPIVSPRTVELWLQTTTRKDVSVFSNRNDISHYVSLGVSGGVAQAFDTRALFGKRLVNDGAWHHVVYTYDARKGKLYVDGRLDAQGTWTRIEGGAPGSIGFDASLKLSFRGCADEVAVYDHVLTAGRVRAHYLASGRTIPRLAPDVVFRARLVASGDTSLLFSLTEPPDRYVLPFGGGGS